MASHNITRVAGELVVYYQGQMYTAGGPGSNCTVEACPIELSVYGYRPTLPGSAAVIALYGICALIQIVVGIRYRTWGFMVAMVLGCIGEIIGYAGRIMLYQEPWGQSGFIIQICLITMSPVFFAAAIYVMIYKIINYISPSHSRVQPRLIYWFFIICDIISLILQAVGGAMSSTSNGSSTAGVNIALAGLVFQVVSLLFFAVVCADYVIRTRSIWSAAKLPTSFKIFSSFLSLATLLIWVRCVYRIYELSEGYSMDSEALRDEPLFIGLEMVLVLLAAYCLIVAHPGPVFERGAQGPAAEQKMLAQEKTRRALGGSSSESEQEHV